MEEWDEPTVSIGPSVLARAPPDFNFRLAAARENNEDLTYIDIGKARQMDGASYGRISGIVGSWVMDGDLERHGGFQELIVKQDLLKLGINGQIFCPKACSGV